jgi:PAS domain S-box-containing protein
VIHLEPQHLSDLPHVALAFLQALPDAGLAIVDHELRIVALAGPMFEDEPSPLSEGRLLADVVPAATWSSVGPRVREALAGTPQSFDYWTPDRMRCYWVRILPVVDELDRPAGRAVALLQETTRRRQELERLHESEDLLRSVIGTMDEGILTIDAHGVLLTVNEAACRMLGSAAEDLYGDPCWSETFEVHHAGGAPVTPETDPAAAAVRSGAVLRDVPLRITRPDDTTVDVAATYAPLRGPEGDERGLMVLLRDTTVSEWTRAAIVESAMDAIVSIDGAGRVVEFNPAAEQLFGYHRLDALGRDLVDLLVPPALRDHHRVALGRAIEQGCDFAPVGIEVAALRGDGHLVAVALSITATLGSPLGFTAFVREVGDPARARAVLARV